MTSANDQPSDWNVRKYWYRAYLKLLYGLLSATTLYGVFQCFAVIFGDFAGTKRLIGFHSNFFMFGCFGL